MIIRKESNWESALDHGRTYRQNIQSDQCRYQSSLLTFHVEQPMVIDFQVQRDKSYTLPIVINLISHLLVLTNITNTAEVFKPHSSLV